MSSIPNYQSDISTRPLFLTPPVSPVKGISAFQRPIFLYLEDIDSDERSPQDSGRELRYRLITARAVAPDLEVHRAGRGLRDTILSTVYSVWNNGLVITGEELVWIMRLTSKVLEWDIPVEVLRGLDKLSRGASK